MEQHKQRPRGKGEPGSFGKWSRIPSAWCTDLKGGVQREMTLIRETGPDPTADPGACRSSGGTSEGLPSYVSQAHGSRNLDTYKRLTFVADRSRVWSKSQGSWGHVWSVPVAMWLWAWLWSDTNKHSAPLIKHTPWGPAKRIDLESDLASRSLDLESNWREIQRAEDHVEFYYAYFISKIQTGKLYKSKSSSSSTDKLQGKERDGERTRRFKET